MTSSMDLLHALDVAKRAAGAAAAASLPYWEEGVKVERKPDRSPVTAADRAAEQAILSVITETFPDHSILAEESGATPRDPRYRWIIDPIDGTRGFTRGGKFWGSLIAFEVDGEIAAGTLALPALGEVYAAARGHGAYCNDARLHVRDGVRELADATLSLGEMKPLFQGPWGPAVLQMVADAENTRGYGDLMGVALVLQGVADVWLEAGVAPWDIAPTKVLVEEAGGVFTTFEGTADLTHGTVVAAPPSLHPRVLDRLRAAGQ